MFSERSMIAVTKVAAGVVATCVAVMLIGSSLNACPISKGDKVSSYTYGQGVVKVIMSSGGLTSGCVAGVLLESGEGVEVPSWKLTVLK
jgi:hypothetical protein